MSTPERKQTHREAPAIRPRFRLPRVFGFRSQRVLFDNADDAVHGGLAGFQPRRNLLADFNEADPKGRDFADDKSDVE